jgi:predicted ArsR family transcriptional regulator
VSQLQQQARALGDPTRHRIFGLLSAGPEPIGVAELAEVTGLHHNAVRQHLVKLVDAGLVERRRAHASGPGRPRLLYSLAPGVGSRWGPTGPYERLAVWLGEMVRTGDSPQEVGRRAGRAFVEPRDPGSGRADRSVDPVEHMEHGMADEGFAPEHRVNPDGSFEVVLTRCPFSSAAAAEPEPVCGFHLGYAQGLVEGTDVVIDEMIPVDPLVGGCRIRCHMAEQTRG